MVWHQSLKCWNLWEYLWLSVSSGTSHGNSLGSCLAEIKEQVLTCLSSDLIFNCSLLFCVDTVLYEFKREKQQATAQPDCNLSGVFFKLIVQLLALAVEGKHHLLLLIYFAQIFPNPKPKTYIKSRYRRQCPGDNPTQQFMNKQPSLFFRKGKNTQFCFTGHISHVCFFHPSSVKCCLAGRGFLLRALSGAICHLFMVVTNLLCMENTKQIFYTVVI